MTQGYYGLPQEIWDDLCFEAENILQDNELGTHLAAIYPAGNRIYGLEACAPGLFCLYIDSPNSLLDPLRNPSKLFEVFHIKESHSPIIMADLHDWVGWILNNTTLFTWSDYAFLHMLPFGRHILHQESSIDEILNTCYRGLKETNFCPHLGTGYRQEFCHLDLLPSEYLFNRTLKILQETHSFTPNINHEWDSTISQNITIEDQQKIKNLLLNKNISTNEKKYLSFRYLPTSMSITTLNEIRKSVIDFYRFQL